MFLLNITDTLRIADSDSFARTHTRKPFFNITHKEAVCNGNNCENCPFYCGGRSCDNYASETTKEPLAHILNKYKSQLKGAQ